jgi:TRAP-type C4-dicarboxylate transport system permease small subunit
MNIIRAFDRWLTATVTALLVSAFAIMLGLAALQVFLRLFFHTGVIWGDVAARNLVIWVGFFGAFLATRENKQFRIDVLTRLFSPRFRLWFAVVTDLFAAVVCGFLAKAGFTFVKVGIDPESTVFLHIPQTVVAMIVPVGFGLLVVQFLIRMLESIVSATSPKIPEGET